METLKDPFRGDGDRLCMVARIRLAAVGDGDLLGPVDVAVVVTAVGAPVEDAVEVTTVEIKSLFRFPNLAYSNLMLFHEVDTLPFAATFFFDLPFAVRSSVVALVIFLFGPIVIGSRSNAH